MARSSSSAVFLAVLLASLGLTLLPARAQFGSIFSGPPRPPAGVPQQAPAPMGVPSQMPPEELDDEDQPPPRPAQPPVRTQRQPQAPQQQQGNFSSQPLPPPGGDVAAPAQPPQQQQAAPGLAPGQTLPPVQQAAPPPGQRPLVARGTPAPANVAPQPGDEVITELPAQKIANPTAVFAGLDKITGRIISFDVALNETVQFGALQVTPRVCYTRPPTETANTDTFVEVNEVTLQGEVKRIFAGWMFASSPGLHAVEHPIYDVWLTDCKGGSSAVAEAPADASKPARAPAATKQPPVQQRPQQPVTQQRPPLQPGFFPTTR